MKRTCSLKGSPPGTRESGRPREKLEFSRKTVQVTDGMIKSVGTNSVPARTGALGGNRASKRRLGTDEPNGYCSNGCTDAEARSKARTLVLKRNDLLELGRVRFSRREDERSLVVKGRREMHRRERNRRGGEHSSNPKEEKGPSHSRNIVNRSATKKTAIRKGH